MAFAAVMVSGIFVACSDEDDYERNELFEHDSTIAQNISIDKITSTSAEIHWMSESYLFYTTDRSKLEDIETVKKEMFYYTETAGFKQKDIAVHEYSTTLDELSPNITYYILPYYISKSSYGKKETYTSHYGDILSFTTTNE